MKFKINYKLVRLILVVGVIVLIFVFIYVKNNYTITNNKTVTDVSLTDIVSKDIIDKLDCNVLGINLHGNLMTYVKSDDQKVDLEKIGIEVSSEDIVNSINIANDKPEIKAIVIEVDSSGGLPVAGEEVANAIKMSTKPVIAFIRQMGLSAAYWAISSAKHIFASKNSDIGSIGVTASYLDEVDKNKKDGYTYVQLIAGKYKDLGNPDRLMTTDERALFLRDLNIIHENFINDVANNRGIDINDVRKIADGSSVLGEQAKSLNLIDEIGGMTEVEKYISNMIGEKVKLCW